MGELPNTDHVDFLVIGSGIAGLTFALKTAQKLPDSSICIITKDHESESNTKYAQGGIAAVTDSARDDFSNHVQDTIKAGDGLCEKRIVEMVVKEGPERVAEMIEWGTLFDKTPSGQYDLGKEGGHSHHRIIHHKDMTGLEIENALLRRINETPNIKLLPYYFAIDLITQHHLGMMVKREDKVIECFGVYAMNIKEQRIEKILAKFVLIATGGVGQMYKSTTNPLVATGDGIAMAYRAKAVLENMEFIQFHPTALYNPGENPAFLITEAVRGKGGELKTKNGEPFMGKYDKKGSLAPRDIVARSIDNEIKISGEECVFLDCRGIPLKEFQKLFPNINNRCIQIGVDVSKDMIPVVPSAHYSCGGIKTDEWGRTSIKGLYVCGESASTGLHGANRLASNSLLEALVFAHRCFEDTSKKLYQRNFNESIPDWNDEGTTKPKEQILITQNLHEIKSIMSNYLGVVRTNVRLQRALNRVKILEKEIVNLFDSSILSPQLCELRNLVTVAYLVTQFASERDENRGLHYNKDDARP